MSDKLIAQTLHGRFAKGKSGNPGGFRKVQRDLILLARESVPDAFRVAREILLEVANPNRDRLDAAKFLTSYGLGAPPKIADESPERHVDPVGQLTVDELRSLARQSLADDAAVGAEDASDDDSDETEH